MFFFDWPRLLLVVSGIEHAAYLMQPALAAVALHPGFLLYLVVLLFEQLLLDLGPPLQVKFGGQPGVVARAAVVVLVLLVSVVIRVPPYSSAAPPVAVEDLRLKCEALAAAHRARIGLR